MTLMRYKRLFWFVVTFFLVVLKAVSQNDLTLSFMENIYQASYVNPAAIPIYKLSVGLPLISSFNTQVTNTGFSYGQLVKDENGTKDPSKQYTGDIQGVLPYLDKENYFYTGAQIDLFHIKLKIKNIYVSAFSQEKNDFRYSYPKELMELAANGNAAYIGHEVQLKNLAIDYNWYRTMGFGFAKEGKHWNIGMNVKYLGGIANVNFNPRNTGVKIEDEYFQVSSTSDMTLNTSGLPEDDDIHYEDQFYDSDGNPNVQGIQRFVNPLRNPGAGIDIAATYKPNDKWNFTASMVNLGFIRWRSQIYNRHIIGGKNFSGFDVFGYFLNQEDKPADQYYEEFKESFAYTTTQKSYTTWLIPQLYLTAKYNLSFKTHLAGMVYLEYYKKLRPAFTFAVYHKFGRVLNVVGSYNVQHGLYDNVGLGVMVKAGPCQFYLGGDNIVVPLLRSIGQGFEINKKVVDPIKTYNVRVGMNLVFGNLKQTDLQSYEFKK